MKRMFGFLPESAAQAGKAKRADTTRENRERMRSLLGTSRCVDRLSFTVFDWPLWLMDDDRPPPPGLLGLLERVRQGADEERSHLVDDHLHVIPGRVSAVQ